ncbi:cytochrome P450 [Chytriomyces sp. MP71]|nr:cytochrome P450 [Chytriomyces sp. MP71]KAI8608250.1 cytochrome P450 [Chytriomyces sp. MP71]
MPSGFPFTIIGNIPGKLCTGSTRFESYKLGNPEIIREEAAGPYFRWAKQFKSGVIRYFHIFNRPRILVTSSSGLRHIFGTHASNYGKDQTGFALLNKVLGKGLLTVEDAAHKHQRAIINPVFRVKHLHSLLPVFTASGFELCDTWVQHLDASANGMYQFELSEEMSKPTLDVIGRAGFGYEFNATAEGQSPLYEEYKIVLSRFNIGEAIIGTFAPFLNYLIPARRRALAKFEHSAAEIRRNCRLILDQRKRAVAEGDESANDLLSVLLKANNAEAEKNRLTEEEVMAQAMTFLAAGHETTSVALTWTIDFLANHPTVQHKLLAELRTHMPTPTSLPAQEYLTNQKTYLAAVCNESLRLVPPAPLVNRVSLADDVIDGWFVPKGTTIFISPAVNHRLEEYWGPDALEFKPERWMQEGGEEEGRPYGAFMPFVLGPRNCIGQRFAVLEMRALLAVLARGFEFVKVEQGPIKKRLRLTWKPEPGIQMMVRKLVE